MRVPWSRGFVASRATVRASRGPSPCMDNSHANGGARLRRDDLWALLVVGALVGDAVWLGWQAREPTPDVAARNSFEGSPGARRAPGAPNAPKASLDAAPTVAASSAAALPAPLRLAPDPATASPRELRALPGIGEARAIAIADARWRLPPGRSLGLGDITGIGPVTESRVRALLDHARLRAGASSGPPDVHGLPRVPPAPAGPDGASRAPGAEPRDAPAATPTATPSVSPADSPSPEPRQASATSSRSPSALRSAVWTASSGTRLLPLPAQDAGGWSRTPTVFAPRGPDRRPSALGAGSGGRVGAVHSSDPFPPTTLGHLPISPDRRAAGAEAAHRPP